MKFKENVDVWSCFEKALETKVENHYFYRQTQSQPINDILELENEDWVKAIELCKEFKKSPLKKEMELGYRNWLDNKVGGFEVSVSRWLKDFTSNISTQRRRSIYSNTNKEIREQVKVVFKEHFELLERFKELNSLYLSFNQITFDYHTHKVNYDNRVKQLETFRNLKNSGLQPQNFDWSLIEPQVEDEV